MVDRPPETAMAARADTRPDGPTVGALLRAAAARFADSASPRLDAEVLMAHALGADRAAVLARVRDRLAPGDAARFAALSARRAAGEPLAYVTGTAWFDGLALSVGPGVLIPRPETELLVAWAADRWLRTRPRAGDAGPLVDIGTGSGAVALALARRLPAARLVATDRSARALTFARRNAARLDLAGRVTWCQADLLPVRPRRFRMVVANLPYVGLDERADVAPDVLAWEPHEALFAGADGLDEIRRLLAQLPGRLLPGGGVGLEIGWRQGPPVLALAASALPGATVTLHRDLAGLPRLVTIEDVPCADGPAPSATRAPRASGGRA